MLTILVIVLSTLTFSLETVKSFQKNELIFDKLEKFYCIFFTLDFLLRFSCCPSKRNFIRNILSWIDFLSTIQFYIAFLLGSNNAIQFLFVLRLLRIFRLFRFFKKLSGMLVIGQTLKQSAQELCLLVVILTVPMIIFSTMIYYAEKVIYVLYHLFIYLFILLLCFYRYQTIFHTLL